jgi:Transposase DDE domain
MSLDGSIIELSATMFDWAKYRQRKGAIKLHLLLDHDGYLPSFAVVTDGKYSELKVARGLCLEADTILAIDRGYNDYGWFGQLTRDGVFFVTRMKTNTVYTTVEVCAVPAKGNVLSDEIVSLPALDKDGEAPVLFRRIEYWNADKQEILVFFTNLLHLAASTVAAIYKDRWAVELFFKALKGTARVKSFLGTSANAVKTQIWTALIAMLILKFLQMKSSFGWSLSNLAALLRQQLFIFRDLWAWLNNPLEGPPAARQLAEQLPMPLVW